MKKRINSPFTFTQIRGVQNLKRLGWILGEKPDYLIELAIQKNNYYDPFVDKKPGKKPRLIDRPTGELLRIQTKIRDRLLDLAPMCKATYGGVLGKSTKDNAEQHLHKNTLVKLDLRDCFHSTKARMVRRLFRSRLGYSEPVSNLLTEICTYEGHVPVGSTLSSALVNLVLNPVWESVDRQCSVKELAFTTWIDDIAISGKAAEREIETIKKIVNSYGYRISWNKKEITKRHMSQVVTGIGVNTSVTTVPRKRRYAIVKSIVTDPISPITYGKLNYAVLTNPRQGKQLSKLQTKLMK